MPVVVIGEALVDLIEDWVDGEPVYRPRWGGSPLNLAVGLSRQGVDTELVAPLADDHFGRQLAHFATGEGIGLTHCPTSPSGTTLAVATQHGEHMMFDYYGSWKDMWSIGPIDIELVNSASVVHAGSTALNGDPARSSVQRAFKDASGITTLDPNPRRMLIADLDDYRAFLWELIRITNIVKLSDDDARLLMPDLPPLEVAKNIHESGAQVVLLTCASEGAFAVTSEGVVHSPAASGSFLDPTGAGDSFMAEVITNIVKNGLPNSLGDWRDVLRWANVAAAVTCSRQGGAEAMPTTAEVAAEFEKSK
jgi:fructokinase